LPRVRGTSERTSLGGRAFSLVRYSTSLPCLLPASLLARSCQASATCQCLDCVRVLLWTHRNDAPLSGLGFGVAAQAVASGAVVRLAEAVKAHVKDPAVATAAQQVGSRYYQY